MDVNEIEQVLKNIPDELYKIPKYGELLKNIEVYKYSRFVQLHLFLYTGIGVILVHVFDDNDFTLRICNMDEDEVFNLGVGIKDVADKLRSYLSIFGFNCITL